MEEAFGAAVIWLLFGVCVVGGLFALYFTPLGGMFTA
jgi:hypothetical protein